MRRFLLTLSASALLAGTLQGCSVVYCRTDFEPDPDRHVTEMGLLGFPERTKEAPVCGGLIPLWRSSTPVKAQADTE